jgi:hypothetical protein
MKSYGFFVISRKRRWRISLPGDGPTEWFDAEGEAKAMQDEWKDKAVEKRDEAHRQAVEKSSQARAKFVEDCAIEIVSVHNPKLFQVDFRKPTVTLPDGTTKQFDEGTQRQVLDEYIEKRAWSRHPDPSPGKSDFTPEIEDSYAWDSELFIDGARRSLPEIENWSYFYPMDSVAATLNGLAEEGWSVVHVSEDRGLYASNIAQPGP